MYQQNEAISESTLELQELQKLQEARKKAWQRLQELEWGIKQRLDLELFIGVDAVLTGSAATTGVAEALQRAQLIQAETRRLMQEEKQALKGLREQQQKLQQEMSQTHLQIQQLKQDISRLHRRHSI